MKLLKARPCVTVAVFACLLLPGAWPQSRRVGEPITQIIRYTPSLVTPDSRREGYCWTSSVAAPHRPDAWRCMEGNAIRDPCFSLPDRQRVICGANPAAGKNGFALRLTKLLPNDDTAPVPARENWGWLIELGDGALCTPFTGTRPLVALSDRLSGSLKQHAAKSLAQWFETLPFPLASILRAWQATPSQDFKTKHEHLLHFFLHFFEGTAEFVSVILLSAFSSNEALFASHKHKITESMQKQNLSFQRATFGTWKLVVEYLGKQTRELLSGNKDARALCADIFSDPSLALPEALARKELAAILSTTNKMRNDWSGHGGVVGQEEAQLRNEQLLGEVQKLRDAIAETWTTAQLIHASHCRPRGGLFENEVAVLMGSNSEFLKETRPMVSWLDIARLYLCNKESERSLKLLPLVQVGPSPQSARNACYFFNRLERDGAACRRSSKNVVF